MMIAVMAIVVDRMRAAYTYESCEGECLKKKGVCGGWGTESAIASLDLYNLCGGFSSYPVNYLLVYSLCVCVLVRGDYVRISLLWSRAVYSRRR